MKKNENSAIVPGASPFAPTCFHGTKADLTIGHFISGGLNSNFGQRKNAKYSYLTATLDAAIWALNLHSGKHVKEFIW